jgi:hypothetical protein
MMMNIFLHNVSFLLAFWNLVAWCESIELKFHLHLNRILIKKKVGADIDNYTGDDIDNQCQHHQRFFVVFDVFSRFLRFICDLIAVFLRFSRFFVVFDVSFKLFHGFRDFLRFLRFFRGFCDLFAILLRFSRFTRGFFAI